MTNGEEISSDFASRINSLIGENESVAAFARRVNLNQAAIDRYIKGLREPNAQAIRKISLSCGVSSDWLLCISTNPNGEDYSDWRKRALAAERKLEKVSKALSHALKGFEELQEAIK